MHEAETDSAIDIYRPQPWRHDGQKRRFTCILFPVEILVDADSPPQALVSGTSIALHKDIVSSTKGIIFMGTPHHGSGYARSLNVLEKLISWLNLMPSDSTNLADELLSFSNTLCDINDTFAHPEMEIDMEIFYEQKPTRLPPPYLSDLVRTFPRENFFANLCVIRLSRKARLK